MSEKVIGALPTPHEVLSSARSSRKEIQKLNNDLYNKLDDSDFELPIKEANPAEIKAIMGIENEPVIEENEHDASNDIPAIDYNRAQMVSSRTIDVVSRSDMPSGRQYTTEEIDEIVAENERLKQNQEKSQEMIFTLKSKLKEQKRKTTMANSNKVNYLAEKSDLEDFFLDCIEQVRKDIVKRKAKSDSLSGPRRLNKSSSALNYEGGLGVNGKIKGLSKAKLKNFTKTDKSKVIEMLISNEQVLLFLYEKLFPYQNQRPQSVRTNIDVPKMRPTSSQPSLTTAQSFVPPNLLHNQPSSRFVMEDGTTVGSPTKMDARFLPHQNRAKTAQSAQRRNLNNR